MSKLFQCRWIGLCAIIAGCSMYVNSSFANRDFKPAINSGLCPALGFLGLYIASSFRDDQWAYNYLNFGRLLSLICLRISILHDGDSLMKTCITTAGLLPWVSNRIYWLASPNIDWFVLGVSMAFFYPFTQPVSPSKIWVGERSFNIWPWTKYAYQMLNLLRLLVVFLVYQIWKGRHLLTERFFLEKILLSEILLAFIPFVIRLDDMFSLDYFCEIVSVFCAIWSLSDIK